MVDVVLAQWILVDYQYQHNSEVLYTFTTNKSYGFLLNFKANNLVFLTPYNTNFHDITITFTDQNGIPLATEDRFNLARLINK